MNLPETMNTTMKGRQLNNTKELQAEKRRLTELSKVRKARLDDRVDYFMQNSGSILASTLSYHFILKQLPIVGDFISQREKSTSSNARYSAASEELTPIQKALSFLPVLWKVAQPYLISAVIKRIPTLFGKKK